jgi:beta-glucosidase
MEMPPVLRGVHNALLAHGRAVQVIRAEARTEPVIGWAPTGDVAVPLTESEADVNAARDAYWSISDGSVWNQAWWSDPVIKGAYPENGLEAYGSVVPAHTDAEMAIISQPLDFYGMNLYNGYLVKAGAEGKPEHVMREPGVPTSHFQWRVTPSALYWGPKWVHERYGLPIAITENGLANPDWVAIDGAVHDPQRVDYVSRYVRELRRAAAEGVEVEGYFHWTLMDNFEWAEGFRYRFGLVHVDFATQQRTLKDSAYWFREVIRTNGANIPDESLAEPGS